MAKLRPNQFLLPSGALITELPILFQTEMVQANLEGRKKQTRRTRGLDSINVDPDFWSRKGDPRMYLERFWDSTREINPNPIEIHFVFKDPLGENTYIKSPFGKPGDLLWVKETFGRSAIDDDLTDTPYLYKADYIVPEWVTPALSTNHWKPSIHMPKDAARIWLMIEDIRVERVQEISEEDAIAEGIGRWVETRMKSQPTHYKVYTDSDPEALYTSCPKDSFETLWVSINGEESWQSNPWVWVIRYRILSKTGRPSLEVMEQAYSEIVNPKSEIREEAHHD